MTKKEIRNKLQINYLLISSSVIAIKAYKKLLSAGAKASEHLVREYSRLRQLREERLRLKEALNQGRSS